MKKSLFLISLLLSIATSTCFADTTSSLQTPKKYDDVVHLIITQLQTCDTRQASFIHNGLKIEVLTFSDDTIIHIIPYQLTGNEFGDLGLIDIANNKGHTTINVTDYRGMLDPNLHLVQSLQSWLTGNPQCIPIG